MKPLDQSDCFEDSLFNDTFVSDALRPTRKMVIKKGKKDVKFGAKEFQLDLIGSYIFCFRAVVNVSAFF